MELTVDEVEVEERFDDRCQLLPPAPVEEDDDELLLSFVVANSS